MQILVVDLLIFLNTSPNYMFISGLIGLSVVFTGNFLASRFGHSNKKVQKDLLLPSSVLLFMFFPLIISLPQAHYKLVNFYFDKDISKEKRAHEEQQLFPYAFLICLFSITGCIFIDKYLCLKGEDEEEEEGEELREGQIRINRKTLQFLLTLSIALMNMVNFYYICIEEDQGGIVKEISLFLVFSLIINFAYGYFLSYAGVQEKSNLVFSLFMNSGLVVGFILSFIIEPDITILMLPCICAGFQIYCAMFLGFGQIFSNGQKTNQDKSRYGAMFIALLLTVIYYPACYLLRI